MSRVPVNCGATLLISGYLRVAPNLQTDMCPITILLVFVLLVYHHAKETNKLGNEIKSEESKQVEESLSVGSSNQVEDVNK